LDFAKVFIFIGLFFFITGLLGYIVGPFFPFFKLPGDIFYEKGNFRIYFPIVSCLLFSLLFSLLFYFINLLK